MRWRVMETEVAAATVAAAANKIWLPVARKPECVPRFPERARRHAGGSEMGGEAASLAVSRKPW